MVHSDIDRLGLPPGLVDVIRTLGDEQPPEWSNLPVFLFYFQIQQFDPNRRYAKDYIEFGQLQTVMGQVYQCGSILGHLQPKRGRDLMRLSIGRVEGDPDKLFAMFKRNAKERVLRYRRTMGQFPESIPAMQLTTGYLEAGLHIVENVEEAKVKAHERIPLVDAEAFANAAFNEGIALAITQASLWKKAMAAHDASVKGLSALPNVQLPDMGFLREMVLDLSRFWAQMCRPDLLHLIPESGQAKPNK